MVQARKIVLDASAALELIFNRAEAASIKAKIEAGEMIFVPELFVPEVTSAIYKHHKILKYPEEDCVKLMEILLQIPDEFAPNRDLANRAFQLAAFFKHSPYDMFYVALAEEEEATLLTLDKKLNLIFSTLS